MTVRIAATDNYRHERCPLYSCDRRYCSEHRLLFRDCDTATPSKDGAARIVYEIMDCPKCMSDERQKKFSQYFLANLS